MLNREKKLVGWLKRLDSEKERLYNEQIRQEIEIVHVEEIQQAFCTGSKEKG
jgi:hypothetical protein